MDVEERKAYMKIYRKQNQKRIKEQSRQYYERCKERILICNKIWRQEHVSYFKVYSKNYRKVNKERLRKGAKDFYWSHRKQESERHKIYYQLNKEWEIKRCREYCRLHKKWETASYKKWCLLNRWRISGYKKRCRLKERLKILRIVGKGILRCSECGCDDIDLLEINHKDGGGTKELCGKGNRPYQFYRSIIKEVRRTDDLNLLCIVCNTAHYVKLKYGVNYSVEYVGGKKVVV